MRRNIRPFRQPRVRLPTQHLQTYLTWYHRKDQQTLWSKQNNIILGDAIRHDGMASITEQTKLGPQSLHTIDRPHLGQLGYTPHQFLGMPEPIFPPTKPPWDKPSDISTTKEYSFQSIHIRKNKLHLRIFYMPSMLSGTNYRTSLTARYVSHWEDPLHLWFQQTVSPNLSFALANHLTNTRKTS
jgi:hypothetical protein